MERGNTKHGQRLDEAMAEEVAPLTHAAPIESRADEGRQLEPSGPDDSTGVLAGIVDDVDAPTRLAHDEATARSELARFIPPSVFPATGTEVVAAARAEQATESVLVTLADLDPRRRYETVQSVWEALGGETEHRAHAVEPSDRHRPAPTTPAAQPTSGLEPESEPGDGPRDDLLHGMAHLGLDLAALATWTVASVATELGRRLDRLRARS